MSTPTPRFQLKFRRDRTVHGTGLSIYEVQNTDDLYRVVEFNAGEQSVEVLTEHGWIKLITMYRNEAKDHDEAIRRWLTIQTPADAPF